MIKFALAGVIAVASFTSAACTIAAPEEEPEQQRLLGSDHEEKKLARARFRTETVACCVDGERFECPDESACHDGFDETACIEACTAAPCVDACTREAGGRRPDGTCKKVGACS